MASRPLKDARNHISLCAELGEQVRVGHRARAAVPVVDVIARLRVAGIKNGSVGCPTCPGLRLCPSRRVNDKHLEPSKELWDDFAILAPRKVSIQGDRKHDGIPMVVSHCDIRYKFSST